MEDLIDDIKDQQDQEDKVAELFGAISQDDIDEMEKELEELASGTVDIGLGEAD